MTSISVRPATTADADATAVLLGQLGYPSAMANVGERIARIENGGQAAVLVAIENGAVVGLATAHVLTVINRVGCLAQLTALVVDERRRGSGVGRALVEAVERFAIESGCERLSVTTHLDRAGAHAFYERLGFDHTGRRYGKMLGDQ
jgi:GNAT superfamily N-acetyltransferase